MNSVHSRNSLELLIGFESWLLNTTAQPTQTLILSGRLLTFPIKEWSIPVLSSHTKLSLKDSVHVFQSDAKGEKLPAKRDASSTTGSTDLKVSSKKNMRRIGEKRV